jgi:hypothetical protein
MEQNTHILKSMDLYDDLGKLRIILFWEILKEQNPFLLDPNYHKDNKYSDTQKEYIFDIWGKLYDDFFVRKNDARARSVLSKSMSEIKHLHKINLIQSNLDKLILLDKHYRDVLEDEQFAEYEQSVYDLFKVIDPRIKIQHFKGVDENVAIVERFIQGLINSYNIKKDKTAKAVNNEIENVYEQVVKVESVIGRTLPHINEISVLQWLAYEKEAESIIKNHKQHGTR